MSDLERGLRDLIAELVREEVRRAFAEATQRDEFLTTAHAAEVAKVAQGTIRRWIRAGRLTSQRAGRELRVLRSDLAALMRDHGRGDRDRTPEELADDFVRRRRS
ncbi:MAG TPA: helix-turn-helix domain-containing protein [Kofleriaceae bacterium]|jgi:excisionase family DNA binding protein|nr:helix-turn-helix domain-containing protein [Kofleriaceae bacterium]